MLSAAFRNGLMIVIVIEDDRLAKPGRGQSVQLAACLGELAEGFEVARAAAVADVVEYQAEYVDWESEEGHFAEMSALKMMSRKHN